jgi:hypothetical protein
VVTIIAMGDGELGAFARAQPGGDGIAGTAFGSDERDGRAAMVGYHGVQGCAEEGCSAGAEYAICPAAAQRPIRRSGVGQHPQMNFGQNLGQRKA